MPKTFSTYSNRLREYQVVNEDMVSPLNTIYNAKNIGKFDLVLNPHGFIGYDYYVNYNSNTSPKYKDYFKDNFNLLVIKKRDPDFMKNKIKRIINLNEKSIMLFYHYDIEKKIFFSLINSKSISEYRLYPGSVLADVRKYDNINLVKELKSDAVLEVEDFVQSDLFINSKNSCFFQNKDSIINQKVNFKVNANGNKSYKFMILSKKMHPDISWGNLGNNKWMIYIDGEQIVEIQQPKSREWQWCSSLTDIKLTSGTHILSIIPGCFMPIDKIMLKGTEDSCINEK